MTMATPAAGKLAAATAVSVPDGVDDAAALFVINVPCAGPRGAGTVVAPGRQPGGIGIVQPWGEMKICEGAGSSNCVRPGTLTASLPTPKSVGSSEVASNAWTSVVPVGADVPGGVGASHAVKCPWRTTTY